MDEFADVSERFEFDTETLEYVDAPLRGWLTSRTTGEWFAFECRLIVPHLLWHWVLVPAAEIGDAELTLVLAANAAMGY